MPKNAIINRTPSQDRASSLPTSMNRDYSDCMSTPILWRFADAGVEWHTDEDTAREWIASGRVQAVMMPEGEILVPLSEVARWQGVLGQNGLLPTNNGR